MIHKKRAARVTYNGNVLELCSYSDPAERQAAECEATRILEAGGTLADVRRVRPITNERDRWIWLSERLSPDRHATPEELLMLAVVEVTMRDLHGTNGRKRSEAHDWVELEDRSHPYGFGSICDVLGRDVDEVRRALLGDGATAGKGVNTWTTSATSHHKRRSVSSASEPGSKRARCQ